MEEFVLSGKPRKEFGSRAARRLRAQGLLPANIYGHGEANTSVLLDARQFGSFFEAGHRIAKIKVDEQEEHGVVKEVQYDSMGSELLHVDFTRVDADEMIIMAVPIDHVGVPKGVAGGGVLESPIHEIRIEGATRDIPESFQLLIEDLHVGESIRLRDLTAPPGCKILGEGELVVAHVTSKKKIEDAPVGPEESAEPEVITRKKEEETDS